MTTQFNGILKAASAALSIHTAKNVRVVDGDTIYADIDAPKWMRETRGEYVRFTGIDAPAAGTPEGDKATAWLKDKIGDNQVTLIIKNSRDLHGRLYAEAWLEGEGKSLNQQLVEAGAAVVYKDLEMEE
ncbi:MAG TPA: thermonuclease family protein [Thermoflexales bacterium]|mgnify:CR=1 FL=1|nr:thermonuclease family protein [Thermoflexales bacterium]HQX75276.1 thermonuclease family protein [Thermoflexales bacterium]HRA01159.1 thermonuclease family protein [Thermoflexales bacterium]